MFISSPQVRLQHHSPENQHSNIENEFHKWRDDIFVGKLLLAQICNLLWTLLYPPTGYYGNRCFGYFSYYYVIYELDLTNAQQNST